ncbi:MAG TPA: hypothetical protein VJH23_05965 [archaeon]|nr:hypothetical protein [archaeon]
MGAGGTRRMGIVKRKIEEKNRRGAARKDARGERYDSIRARGAARSAPPLQPNTATAEEVRQFQNASAKKKFPNPFAGL